ncbi:TetR/AcrR family transcriptional regulator [Arthrobacter sp. G.S.26]|uniref:TetR/AcrR family transcriptional regulator n=1 Tax=Arthrobacter sp. G.S.26 TaxID=3433706 RepID=UPI003D76C7AA
MNEALGRRERRKADKRLRIMTAAAELFAVAGVRGVTTQQVADRAGLAIGTLYLYASTKAELLIMVQNVKFELAIQEGISAARLVRGPGAVPALVALLEPVVKCIREHPENGRSYQQELVFGDPREPFRQEGLQLSRKLELVMADILRSDGSVKPADADVLARAVAAILHLGATAAVYAARTDAEVLDGIRCQIQVSLGSSANQ